MNEMLSSSVYGINHLNINSKLQNSFYQLDCHKHQICWSVHGWFSAGTLNFFFIIVTFDMSDLKFLQEVTHPK